MIFEDSNKKIHKVDKSDYFKSRSMRYPEECPPLCMQTTQNEDTSYDVTYQWDEVTCKRCMKLREE